jgi:hypothetical protein
MDEIMQQFLLGLSTSEKYDSFVEPAAGNDDSS